MGRDDWFRRTVWTPQDVAEFQARLNRSRGDPAKAQYLRIQACHLAQAGLHNAALELLDQLLQNYPEPSELASTQLQRAESCAATGKNAEAIDSFQASLAAERAYLNVRTNAPLSFAWFIVVGQHVHLYDKVEGLLEGYEKEGNMMFPFQRHQAAVVRALLAFEQGRLAEARAFAEQARSATGDQHSGFRYQAKVGLAEALPAEVERRLAAIGGR